MRDGGVRVTSLLPGHAHIDAERCDHKITSSILRKVIEKKFSLKGCDRWIVSSILSKAIQKFRRL